MRTGGLESAPDLELGRSFRDGDEAALAALYDRHLPGIYDLGVDTSILSPEACADVVRQHLEDGPPPLAFRRLAAMAMP